MTTICKCAVSLPSFSDRHWSIASIVVVGNNVDMDVTDDIVVNILSII